MALFHKFTTANFGLSISYSEAIEWAIGVLQQPGINAEVVAETNWSSVLKISTPQRSVYLKQTPKDLFLEANIIKLLRDKCDIITIPEIIASNKKLNCFLMTQCGDLSLRSYFVGKLQVDILKDGISTYIKLQKATTGFIDELLELGVPDWRLDKFPVLYKQLISSSDYLTEYGLTVEQQGKLHQYQSKVTALCVELASFEIAECLNHSDLHDNNILYNKDHKTTAIIDLGETAINHPLFSLAACLEGVKNRYNLTVDSVEYKILKECVFSNSLADKIKFDRAIEIINILLPVYLMFTQKRFLDAINLPYNAANPMSVKQHEKINRGFIWVIDNMQAEL